MLEPLVIAVMPRYYCFTIRRAKMLWIAANITRRHELIDTTPPVTRSPTPIVSPPSRRHLPIAHAEERAQSAIRARSFSARFMSERAINHSASIYENARERVKRERCRSAKPRDEMSVVMLMRRFLAVHFVRSRYFQLFHWSLQTDAAFWFDV